LLSISCIDAFVSAVHKEITPEEPVHYDIGVQVQRDHDQSKVVSVATANRKSKELEQAARHRTRELHRISMFYALSFSPGNSLVSSFATAIFLACIGLFYVTMNKSCLRRKCLEHTKVQYFSTASR